MNAITPSGELITAPSWYPPYLPKFYRQVSGQHYLRPLPLDAKTTITENDILDCLLMLQMIVGTTRETAYDFGGWYQFPCVATDKVYKAVKDTLSLTPASPNAVLTVFPPIVNGYIDFSNLYSSGDTINDSLYSKLQNRYIEHEGDRLPFIKEMQAIGGGIDLASIPLPGEAEIARPTAYPSHMPSLFKSVGGPGRQPAGVITFKPMFHKYEPTKEEVASAILYAQPIVSAGPTPYPLNFSRPETKQWAGQLDGAYWVAYRLALPYGGLFMGGFFEKFPVMPAIKKWVLGYSITVEPEKIPQTNSTLVAIGNALLAVVKMVPYVGTALTLAQKIANDANDTSYLPGFGYDVAKTIQDQAAAKQAAQQQAAAAASATSTSNVIKYIVLGLLLVLVAIIFLNSKKSKQ